ncbi:MAG: 4a-hydroxytetrahydrobiopterin dehydratase [Paucimonas sp.]|jgi:4a-hydroxytetrahydrobiopterin dehydratase|nr:4a-hydroxytetrahydrobiopterin dehydratase [Paucimonas sp.]
MTLDDLLSRECSHQTVALPESSVAAALQQLNGWSLESGFIVKQYAFKNYYETLAFINAIAFIIHAEDHHPELTVGYNRCTVRFNTHSVNDGQGGISENDFICAAKIDALLTGSFRA